MVHLLGDLRLEHASDEDEASTARISKGPAGRLSPRWNLPKLAQIADEQGWFDLPVFSLHNATGGLCARDLVTSFVHVILSII